MNRLESASMKLVKESLKVKKGENVLLVTDEPKLPIARHVARFINQAKGEVTTYLMTESIRPIKTTTKLLKKILKDADAVIYMLDARMAEKTFRIDLVDTGTRHSRICMMPGITEDMMRRLVFIDFKEMDRKTRRIINFLRDKEDILVTNRKGTEIRFSVKGRKWLNDNGDISRKGMHGNLPAGECFTCPVERSLTGTIVISLIEGKVGPGKMIFERGELVHFEGRGVKAVMKSAGSDSTARIVGEFGIGTNFGAKICENMLEAEKAYGTVHFAIGDSYGLGKNKSRFHSDALVEKVTLVANGRIIIKDGKFVV
jgi:leucyl aminopeptidase (aminopeptidase T)